MAPLDPDKRVMSLPDLTTTFAPVVPDALDAPDERTMVPDVSDTPVANATRPEFLVALLPDPIEILPEAAESDDVILILPLEVCVLSPVITFIPPPVTVPPAPA